MVVVLRLLMSWLIVVNSLDAESTTISVCPGDDIDIGCPPGRTLVMRRAFYGPVLAGHSCGPVLPDPRLCIHPDALGGLARSCFKKDRCFIPAKEKPELFNYLDPCRGFERFLEVEYECIEGSNIKSICDSMPQGGGLDKIRKRGYVTSANYPDHYFNGQSCRMSLRGEEGQYLEITMLDIELEFSPTTNQCYDFVVFHQRKSNGKSRILCKPLGFIEDDLEYPLRDQNTVQISFESSGEHPHRGFLFEYKVTGCPTSTIPPPPLNGVIRLYQMSFFVLYGCIDGFRLESQTTGFLMCRNESAWIGDRGFCVETDEPPQPLPPLPTPIKPGRTPDMPTVATMAPTVPPIVVTSQRFTRRPPEPTQPPPPPSPPKPSPTTRTRHVETSAWRSTTLSTMLPLSTPRFTTPQEKSSETSPKWAMEALPDDTTTRLTTKSTSSVSTPTTLAPVVQAAADDIAVPVIAAIAGGLALALLLGIILTAILVHRKIQKRKLARTIGLSSLRPSAHACVSIPNTYAGVGYAAAKSASLSSHNSQRPQLIAAATASTSQTRTGGRRRSGHSDLSYESELYDRITESPKGSTEPILTISSNSFDCVDMSPAASTSSSKTGLTNPLAFYKGGSSPEAPSGTTERDLIDSDLIFQALKPSLETIREECEGGSHGVFKEPLPSDDESSVGETADRKGLNGSLPAEEQGSVQSTDSDPKPRVKKTRLRTRPISMGEADQPETKRRIDKVEYPLFMDDTTGNLENFLDHRRVSV